MANIMTQIMARADGLITAVVRGDRALWTRRKLRKAVKCCQCGKQMGNGQDAYGPTGNQEYRYFRACVPCVEGK